VAYAPDGKTVAGATAAGEIVVWDVRTGAKQLQIGAGLNQRSDLVHSPDGSLLAGAVGRDVILWDADTGEQRAVIPVGFGEVLSLAFSADGRQLAAGDRQGNVALFQY
jgi:WD40 repeat protein